MKKLLLFFLMIMTCQIYAQETFHFQLTFIDAIGNSDTLIIGYDSNATDGIDSDFMETNIHEQDWQKDFEVRVTNAQQTRDVYDTVFTPSLQCKKQIVKYDCESSNNSGSQQIYIDIKCSNWPITVEWNSTMFDNNCLKSSSIGFIEIADMGISLSEISNINTSQVLADKPYDYYLSTNGDTIRSTFWLYLSGQTVNIFEQFNSDITVFPNPTNDLIIICVPEALTQNGLNIEIINLDGKRVKSEQSVLSKTILDLKDLTSGIYFIHIYNDTNIYYIQKVIKN